MFPGIIVTTEKLLPCNISGLIFEVSVSFFPISTNQKAMKLITGGKSAMVESFEDEFALQGVSSAFYFGRSHQR